MRTPTAVQSLLKNHKTENKHHDALPLIVIAVELFIFSAHSSHIKYVYVVVCLQWGKHTVLYTHNQFQFNMEVGVLLKYFTYLNSDLNNNRKKQQHCIDMRLDEFRNSI